MTDEFDEYLRRNPMPTDIEDKNDMWSDCIYCNMVDEYI